MAALLWDSEKRQARDARRRSAVSLPGGAMTNEMPCSSKLEMVPVECV